MTPGEIGQSLRLMRDPEAPRVRRLEDLLITEMGRGNCDETLAKGLLSGFLSFEFDYAMDADGELRWWLVTDREYAKMWRRGLIKPNE